MDMSRKGWLKHRRQYSNQFFNRLMEKHDGKCHWCGEVVIRKRSVSRTAFISTDERRVTFLRHGKRITTRLASIDHIPSLARGGSAELPNLVIACVECNWARNTEQQLRERKAIENHT